MSRKGTLFNLGVILKWAEQGLTKASIALEKRVNRFAGKVPRADTPKLKTKPNRKHRKRELQELAKSQDSELERLETLEKSKSEMGQEADIERD